MESAKNVNNQTPEDGGVNHVIQKDFAANLVAGQVEIMKSTSLFGECSLKQKVIEVLLNGFLLIDCKMLSLMPKEVLARFSKQHGLMAIFGIGACITKNGQDGVQEKKFV
jgi:hypothetical protein